MRKKKQITLDPIGPQIAIVLKDELEIKVKRDFIYFYAEIDQTGATFRISKKLMRDLLE